MNPSARYQRLTFAGTLPFVACAVLLLADIGSVRPLGQVDALAASYGLAIVTFLAGTHWAFQLLRPSETPHNLFFASNAVFLAAWFAWISGSLAWALLAQVLAFAYLLVVDHRLSASGITTPAYFRVRSAATAAAMVSLLTILAVR